MSRKALQRQRESRSIDKIANTLGCSRQTASYRVGNWPESRWLEPVKNKGGTERTEKAHAIAKAIGITLASALQRVDRWPESRWYEPAIQPRSYLGKSLRQWSLETGYSYQAIRNKAEARATLEEMQQKKPLPTEIRVYRLFRELYEIECIPGELKERIKYEMDN